MRRSGSIKSVRKHDTVEFHVIGELKTNPHHLLMLGDDGHCYGYDTLTGEINELVPDDSWAMDMVRHILPWSDTIGRDLAS